MSHRSLIVEFIMPDEIADALALYVQPNTKLGHTSMTVDCHTNLPASMCAGLMISHIINLAQMQQKARENEVIQEKSGSQGGQKVGG